MIALIIRAVCLSLMLFMVLCYPTAAAAAGQRPTVMVTDYNVYPDVLMPGDTGTITVTISNMEEQARQTETTKRGEDPETITTETTMSINARMESIHLFGKGIEVVTTGDLREEYLNVGDLGPGKSTTISFAIKAIEAGTFFPYVRIAVKEGNDVRFPLQVKVDASDVKISADAPSSIAVGEITTIGLTVLNTRRNTIEAVRLVPVTEGVKFSPSEVPIGTMEPDELVNARFDSTLGDSFARGENEIAFTVEYKNGDNYHESACTIPIEVVDGYGVRLIASTFPSSVVPGEMAEIELDTVNTRSDEAKSAIVVPLTEGLVYQPSEYYIGNMRPGDLYTARFTIDTTNMNTGVNNLDFKVIYRDANGYQDSDVCTLPLNALVMGGAAKAHTASSVSAGSILPLAVILVLTALGLVLYVRLRKRNQ